MRSKSSLILAVAIGLGCNDILLPAEKGDYPTLPDRAGFGALFDRIKVEFGETECGQVSKEQVLTITNRTDHALYWDGQLGKGDESPFSLSEDQGNLAAGQSARIRVRPRPIPPSSVTEGNAFGDVLRVKTDDPALAGPFEIPLEQTAKGAVLRFSVPDIDLGKSIDAAAVTKPAELRNVGNAPITLTLDPVAPFEVTPAGDVVVPPGGAVQVTTKFTPSDRFGTFEGPLKVKVKSGVLCGNMPQAKLAVARSDKLAQMCGGEGFTCALGESGRVFCWGANFYGQLGNGNTVETRKYKQVETLTDATTISCGYTHACAIKKDKTAVCWGSNGEKKQFEAQSLFGPGQLGNGTKIDTTVPVPVTGLTDVVDIGAGAGFTCALRNQGAGKAVWCWGMNARGQLGQNAALPAPPAVAVPSLVPVQVPDLGTTAVKLGVSRAHSCAIKADRSLWCWGENDNTEIGNSNAPVDNPKPVQVEAIPDAVDVAVAGYHTCAVRATGQIYCFGTNLYGRLGIGDEKPPGSYATDVVHFNIETPAAANAAPVVGLTAPLEIIGGSGHTCALRADKVPVCWGRNNQGMVGHGVFGNGKVDATHGEKVGVNSIPVPVKGLTDVKHVYVAYNHSCALKNDGTAWCWGSDVDGELGDDDDVDKPYPVQVKGF